MWRHLNGQNSRAVFSRPDAATEAKDNPSKEFFIRRCFREMHEDFRFVVDICFALHILEALGQKGSSAARMTHHDDDALGDLRAVAVLAQNVGIITLGMELRQKICSKAEQCNEAEHLDKDMVIIQI